MNSSNLQVVFSHLDLSFIDRVLFFQCFSFLGCSSTSRFTCFNGIPTYVAFYAPLPNSLAICVLKSVIQGDSALRSAVVLWSFTGSPTVTLLYVSWSVCNPFWCKVLLMWIPVSERCRAQTFSCQIVLQTSRTVVGEAWMTSAGTSVKYQSHPFSVTKVEYMWKDIKELAVMHITVLGASILFFYLFV